MEENDAGGPAKNIPRELKVACTRELDSGKGVAEVAHQYQLVQNVCRPCSRTVSADDDEVSFAVVVAF